jgi:hypothetical protein
MIGRTTVISASALLMAGSIAYFTITTSTANGTLVASTLAASTAAAMVAAVMAADARADLALNADREEHPRGRDAPTDHNVANKI